MNMMVTDKCMDISGQNIVFFSFFYQMAYCEKYLKAKGNLLRNLLKILTEISAFLIILAERDIFSDEPE